MLFLGFDKLTLFQFFAFAASAIYGLDTFIKFQIWRGGEPLSIIAEPTTPNEDTTEAKAEY